MVRHTGGNTKERDLHYNAKDVNFDNRYTHRYVDTKNLEDKPKEELKKNKDVHIISANFSGSKYNPYCKNDQRVGGTPY